MLKLTDAEKEETFENFVKGRSRQNLTETCLGHLEPSLNHRLSWFSLTILFDPRWLKENRAWSFSFDIANTGVQSVNNVFHIVDKVENVCVNQYIFDLIDNVEYVVYALYSRILVKNQLLENLKKNKAIVIYKIKILMGFEPITRRFP